MDVHQEHNIVGKENLIIWKPVFGFESLYIINGKGVIKSLHSKNPGKVIKPRLDRAGYFTVRLNKAGKSYTKYVHRLIAEAFVDNLFDKLIINHLDGNKTNNSIKNLQWVNHCENIKHAYQAGLFIKATKEKAVIDSCTGQRYKSVREAAEQNGLKYATCKNYLNGNRSNPTCLKYAA
jgi:hypothetical protein